MPDGLVVKGIQAVNRQKVDEVQTEETTQRHRLAVGGGGRENICKRINKWKEVQEQGGEFWKELINLLQNQVEAYSQYFNEHPEFELRKAGKPSPHRGFQRKFPHMWHKFKRHPKLGFVGIELPNSDPTWVLNPVHLPS
ncbi:hypothetical protein LXL04_032026 [Taraxacum kok-saghyz]